MASKRDGTPQRQRGGRPVSEATKAARAYAEEVRSGDASPLAIPRTIAQAEALDDYLKTEKLDLDHVIELKVAEEILLDRVMARAKQAKRQGHTMRADDNRDALKIRLDAYNQETAPLIEYYRSKQVLWTIDGLRPINAVTQDIFNALKN